MFGALGVGVQLMEAWGALCSLRVAVLGMQGAEELGGCEVRPVLLRVELRKGASDADGTWGEGRLWLAGPCAPGSVGSAHLVLWMVTTWTSSCLGAKLVLSPPVLGQTGPLGAGNRLPRGTDPEGGFAF